MTVSDQFQLLFTVFGDTELGNRNKEQRRQRA
jgi:hypothetical protein